MSYRKELELYPPEEKGLPINVGKTIRSATTHKGVKKVTKEKDGVKIHFYEEDDGKGWQWLIDLLEWYKNRSILWKYLMNKKVLEMAVHM